MIIIYHDVGGAHSTQTAAALHLNRLPKDRIPNAEEFMAIPLYDKAEKSDHGRIRYAGADEWGNMVYTLAREYTEAVTIPALRDLYMIMRGNPEELIFVNMKDTINFFMKVGGYTSRRWHWVWFGRPIVIKGTQRAYYDIVKLVDTVKEQIQKRLSTVS